MNSLAEEPSFEPWVGPEYSERGLDGLRVLLLGESHFTQEGDARPEITEKVVQKYGVDGKAKAFFTKCRKVVDPSDTDSDDRRRAFWNAVAFYNYIQEPVGHTAREEKPTPSMWENAVKPFRSVLKGLRPEAVVVLGKRLWQHLPEPVDVVRKSVDDVGELNFKLYDVRSGSRALAGHITHPSAAISYAAARPRVRALFRTVQEHL